MPSEPEHEAFFGDGPKVFKLPAKLIRELERTTGCGVGALCRRLFQGDFSYDEIREVIRLSLVGGGTAPEAAEALCAAYIDGAPLSASYPLAVAVMECAWFGRAQADVVGNDAFIGEGVSDAA
jgi:hypothetical protein